MAAVRHVERPRIRGVPDLREDQMNESRLPARCAECFKVSEPRPLGTAPDGWMRGVREPGDSPNGRYWCPNCIAAKGWKRVG